MTPLLLPKIQSLLDTVLVYAKKYTNVVNGETSDTPPVSHDPFIKQACLYEVLTLFILVYPSSLHTPDTDERC